MRRAGTAATAADAVGVGDAMELPAAEADWSDGVPGATDVVVPAPVHPARSTVRKAAPIGGWVGRRGRVTLTTPPEP